MHVVERCSEAGVAAAFIRGELAGRFHDEIVAGTRGWRIGGLFDGFPDDIEWHRVALSRDEVLSIRFINWDWWLTITAGSRMPTDAAARIRAGLVSGFDVEGHRPIAARQEHELIALTDSLESPATLVEGHVRLTAYALFPELLPAQLDVLLGVSDQASAWSEF